MPRRRLENAPAVLQLLLEVVSIHCAERISGIHRVTILRLPALAGGRCERLMDEKLQGIDGGKNS